jgi:prefoldin subunit 5
LLAEAPPPPTQFATQLSQIRTQIEALESATGDLGTTIAEQDRKTEALQNEYGDHRTESAKQDKPLAQKRTISC